MQRSHRLLGYGLGVLWLAACGGKLDQAVETTTSAYTIVLVTSGKGRPETITFDDAVEPTVSRIAGPGTDVSIRYRR